MGFVSNYRADFDPTLQDGSKLNYLEPRAPGIVEFLSHYGGLSFEGGLYRIHAVTDMAKWTAMVSAVFPGFKDRIFCFSYDWLGRHFALDFKRIENTRCLILMLEPGSGEVLEIPADFHSFHNQELIDYRNEALASEFYESWLSIDGKKPTLTECVGYRVPLFLGGKDEMDNLEITDMEVYWSITGQLLAKTRQLPDGAKIGQIRIGD
jgi:hypothetical protein